MSTISLCMIVKNEEEVLERCLKSIQQVVDEIIIIDTGSTDQTVEIARSFTDKIYNFEWKNDFSLARNYSFSFATCDYVMWLDADDIIKPEELQKLIAIKKSLSADTYMLKYAIAFTNNKPTFSFYRERILKRSGNPVWSGCVHECITPYGKVEQLDITIEHHKEKITQSDRNLKIYKQTIKKRPLNPRETYYYSRELYDHKKYKESAKNLRKFIKSGTGWIENIIDAHYLLSQCYTQLNLPNKSIKALFATLELDLPRANICCKIGDYFLQTQKYDMAIYWYKIATTCPDVLHKGGFVDQSFYDYYPFLQLCKCFYLTGDIQNSIHYNQKAYETNPNCPIVKSNIDFFNSLLKTN